MDRQVLGRIVRGEAQSISPEDADRLCRFLPITMAQLMAAFHYSLGETPANRLPEPLLRKLYAMSPERLAALTSFLPGPETEDRDAYSEARP